MVRGRSAQPFDTGSYMILCMMKQMDMYSKVDIDFDTKK